jgi:hypothetical protein
VKQQQQHEQYQQQQQISDGGDEADSGGDWNFYVLTVYFAWERRRIIIQEVSSSF